MDTSTEKPGEVFEKTSQTATKNTETTLPSSQSQTLKIVSASDELVKIFSKMNNSKKSFKIIQDPEGNFHELDMISFH